MIDKKLTCTLCRHIWYVAAGDMEQLNNCPFCGNTIRGSIEFDSFDTLDKAMLCAIQKQGTDVFLSPRKLTGYMLDLAPLLQAEIRIFSRVITDEYSRNFYEAFSCSEDGAAATINKVRYALTEREGLSENWADKICGSVLLCVKQLKTPERAPLINVSVEDYHAPSEAKTALPATDIKTQATPPTPNSRKQTAPPIPPAKNRDSAPAFPQSPQTPFFLIEEIHNSRVKAFLEDSAAKELVLADKKTEVLIKDKNFRNQQIRFAVIRDCEIPEKAFARNKYLEVLYISSLSGFLTIPAFAFASCTSLKTVLIDSSFTIDRDAFQGCKNARFYINSKYRSVAAQLGKEHASRITYFDNEPTGFKNALFYKYAKYEAKTSDQWSTSSCKSNTAPKSCGKTNEIDMMKHYRCRRCGETQPGIIVSILDDQECLKCGGRDWEELPEED